jgi:hypothetical protein
MWKIAGELGKIEKLSTPTGADRAIGTVDGRSLYEKIKLLGHKLKI